MAWAGCAFSQQYLTENKGQWNEQVKYKKYLNGAVLYLETDRISVLQYDVKQWSALVQHPHDEHKSFLKAKPKEDIHEVDYHFFDIEFVGANTNPTISGEQVSTYYMNFFLGKDESKWASNVRDFGIVRYTDLYPNVDLIVHGKGSQLKYDFVLNKGAKLEDIAIRYNHIEKLVNRKDSLQIKTSVGSFYERIPLCYYEVDGELTEFDMQFSIDDNGLVTFKSEHSIPATFDRLLIDPEVVFSTYAGNSVDNFGFTATYDENGSLYSGGIATTPDMTFNANGYYPTTPGAFSTTYSGGVEDNASYSIPCDATLNKYSPDGSKLIWATFLGGSHNEYPQSIVVDNFGNLIVFGTTHSGNFPTTIGSFQPLHQGATDLFVTRFNTNATGLLGSTLIGGSGIDGQNIDNTLNYFYADNFRGEVTVDKNNTIYVASCTRSRNFPTVNPFQSKLEGYQDGVILSLDSNLKKMLWGSYIGGNSSDALYSVDLDSTNHLFVSGGTRSQNFPGTKGEIGKTFKGGSSDGIIARISLASKRIDRAAYWGTKSYDQIYSLELDNANMVYVVGQSLGQMPVIGNVYSNPGSTQFISRFDNDLNTVDFSTVFGSGRSEAVDITINAFLVAECKQIYISGWGGAQDNGSTKGLPITKDAYQKTTDGEDFYLMALSKHARHMVYGTYFGGNLTEDHVDGGTSRFDKEGIIYQSVCSSCPEDFITHAISDFPTTPGAYAEKNVSPRCSNAAFKIAFGNLNRPPWLDDSLYRVTVLDTISFDYHVSDPDYDTVYVSLRPENSLKPYMVSYTPESFAIENWYQNLTITAGCDIVGDTVEIEVYALDRGCPLYKDSTATIKIIIDPPPVLDPPSATCLKFLEDNSVELSWDRISQSKYFDRTRLYRINPSGDTSLMTESFTINGAKYIDTDVVSPKHNDYQYFFKVVNVCGEEGPESYHISTVKEFLIPIDGTYLKTATVTDDEKVSLTWLKSTEEDFSHYEIWRKENSDDGHFEKYATITDINDTIFIDKNVKVHKTSYCYVIVVHDVCSHKSDYSNYACTIVLTGESIPFKHTLNWNPYKEWPHGVREYEMSRSVDTGILRPVIALAGDVNTMEDTTWDYCWGGYWYRVKAYEEGNLFAESQSNKIYLIQPPLLHVPNAFTPNGDYLNERWGIVPVFVKEYKVEVFNRWGQKVYESSDVKTDWDGFYQGQQPGQTVYVYKIMYTGWDRSIHHRKGTVTVIK